MRSAAAGIERPREGAAAKERAVRPFLLVASRSTLRSRSSSMMPTWPSSAAFIRGVQPLYSSSGNRPRSSSVRTAVSSPRSTAAQSAGLPCFARCSASPRLLERWRRAPEPSAWAFRSLGRAEDGRGRRPLPVSAAPGPPPRRSAALRRLMASAISLKLKAACVDSFVSSASLEARRRSAGDPMPSPSSFSQRPPMYSTVLKGSTVSARPVSERLPSVDGLAMAWEAPDRAGAWPPRARIA
mmetsp:Transcript_40398/g.125208  ORF Transcript_40398/g.125208 Transcript_40398/m.125208 type:complete len:241 (-) Transcript_40398:1-723(-)